MPARGGTRPRDPAPPPPALARHLLRRSPARTACERGPQGLQPRGRKVAGTGPPQRHLLGLSPGGELGQVKPCAAVALQSGGPGVSGLSRPQTRGGAARFARPEPAVGSGGWTRRTASPKPGGEVKERKKKTPQSPQQPTREQDPAGASLRQ